MSVACSATVTPDDVARPVADPALSSIYASEAGYLLTEPANPFLHIFRNPSYEFSPLILAQIIDLTFQQKSLSLLTGSFIAEEDLLSKG